jgi:hypothetical protein
MQLSKQLDSYFEQLLLSSNEINSLLIRAREEGIDVSKEVKKKYLYRVEVIDNIRNFVNSEDGKSCFLNKKETFDKVLNNIVDIDSINVDLLKSVTQEAKTAMGQINKNKKVLIYSKGAGHEYK